MKKGLVGGSLRAVTYGTDQGGPYIMLHVGLDLSRKRLDFDLLCEDGSRIEQGAVPPDADGLRGLARRLEVYREPICAAIESMNGARFVHDRLEEAGWTVEIADAQKVKGLGAACVQDRQDRRVGSG
jgi:transposase